LDFSFNESQSDDDETKQPTYGTVHKEQTNARLSRGDLSTG